MSRINPFLTFRSTLLKRGIIVGLLLGSIIAPLSGCNYTKQKTSERTHGKKQIEDSIGIKITTGTYVEIPFIFKAKNNELLISDGRCVNLYDLKGTLSETWVLSDYFDIDGGSAQDVDFVRTDSLLILIANHARILHVLYFRDHEVLKKDEFDGGFEIRVQNNVIYTSVQTYNHSINDLEKGVISYRIDGTNCINNGFINGTEGMCADFEIVNNNIVFWYSDYQVHICSVDNSQSQVFPFSVDKKKSIIKFIGEKSGVYFLRHFDKSINKDILFMCDSEFTIEKEKYVNVDYSKIVMNDGYFYYVDSGLLYSYINDEIFVLVINGKTNMTIYRISELLSDG